MTNPDFDSSAAACRAAIAAGKIHPASLADLARQRLRRIAEGLAGAAALNASRAA